MFDDVLPTTNFFADHRTSRTLSDNLSMGVLRSRNEDIRTVMMHHTELEQDMDMAGAD